MGVSELELWYLNILQLKLLHIFHTYTSTHAGIKFFLQAINDLEKVSDTRKVSSSHHSRFEICGLNWIEMSKK